MNACVVNSHLLLSLCLITCERIKVPVPHEITMITENEEGNRKGETEEASLESRIHRGIGAITLLLLC